MKELIDKIGVKKVALLVAFLAIVIIGIIVVIFTGNDNGDKSSGIQGTESELESVISSQDTEDTEFLNKETESINSEMSELESTEGNLNSEIESSEGGDNSKEDKTPADGGNSGQANNNKPSYEDPHKKKYSSFEEVEALINSGVITNYTWVETENMKRYIVGDYSYANDGTLIQYDEDGNIIYIWEYGVLVYPTDNREPQPPSEPEVEEPDPLKPAKYTIVEADDFPDDGYAWHRATFYWHLAYTERGVNDEIVAVRWEVRCGDGKVGEAIPNAIPFMGTPPTLEETKEMIEAVGGNPFEVGYWGHKELYVCLED